MILIISCLYFVVSYEGKHQLNRIFVNFHLQFIFDKSVLKNIEISRVRLWRFPNSLFFVTIICNFWVRAQSPQLYTTPPRTITTTLHQSTTHDHHIFTPLYHGRPQQLYTTPPRTTAIILHHSTTHDRNSLTPNHHARSQLCNTPPHMITTTLYQTTTHDHNTCTPHHHAPRKLKITSPHHHTY